MTKYEADLIEALVKTLTEHGYAGSELFQKVSSNSKHLSSIDVHTFLYDAKIKNNKG